MMKTARKILILLLVLLLGLLLAWALGWWMGQRSAYQDIVSERCWLNKETRDIECIQFIE